MRPTAHAFLQSTEAEDFIPAAVFDQRFTFGHPPDRLFVLLGDLEVVASLVGALLRRLMQQDRR